MGATFSERGFQGSISPALLNSCMIESRLLHDTFYFHYWEEKKIQQHQVQKWQGLYPIYTNQLSTLENPFVK